MHDKKRNLWCFINGLHWSFFPNSVHPEPSFAWMYSRFGMLINQQGTGANPFALRFVNSCFQVAPCSRSERSQSLCSADALPAAAFSCSWCPGLGFSSHQLTASGTDPNLTLEHTRAERESPWPRSTAAGRVPEPAHLSPSLALRRCCVYFSLPQLFPEPLQYALTGSAMPALQMLYGSIKTRLGREKSAFSARKKLAWCKLSLLLLELAMESWHYLKETDERFK